MLPSVSAVSSLGSNLINSKTDVAIQTTKINKAQLCSKIFDLSLQLNTPFNINKTDENKMHELTLFCKNIRTIYLSGKFKMILNKENFTSSSCFHIISILKKLTFH